MSLFRLLAPLFLFAWLVGGGDALGQADLFDAPTGLFGEESAAAAAPAVEEVDSPLRRQLNEHARRGELQLAMAIQALARTGQWSDVDQLLSRTASRNIDQPTLAEMARRIGAPVLLKISRRQELSEPARGALEKLNQAAIAQAEAAEPLRKAIDQLDAELVDDRLAAARTLLAGGKAAIAELVAASVAETPKAPRDDVLRTMLRLGDGGTQALHQLALYGQPALRHRAISALVRIDRANSIVELITALHATDSKKIEIATAKSALQQLTTQLPDRRSTIEMLYADLIRKREAAATVANDNQMSIRWSVNEKGRGVLAQPTRNIIVVYRDATDAAQRLRRVGAESPEVKRAILMSDIGYRVVVDPDWGDRPQLKSVRDAFGDAVRGSSLATAIAESRQQNDKPALVGLLRLIDDSTSEDDSHDLLRSTKPIATPLVEAVSAADPRIRYEAASAITRLSPPSAYVGSSRVMRCLAEMRSLSDRPSAILVETRSEVIQHQEKLLIQLGFDTHVVGSVRELTRVIARGGDLRMIVSKTGLADASPIELIDVVRRMKHGGEIPIVFYGGEAPGINQLRWSASAVLIPRPTTTAAYSGLIEKIERSRRLPPLTAVDRQLYRTAANEMLQRLAQSE